MPVDAQSCSTEPTKVDTLSSEACTRSGTFSLVLSVVLLLLIPYWAERQNYTALSRYLVYRLNLSNTVDSLTEDPTWQTYANSHSEAETMSLAQLLNASVEVTFKAPDANIHLPPALQKELDQSRATAPSRPPGPTNLQIRTTMPINHLPQIATLLSQLNDSELLSRSRQVSNFFNFSITRWTQKRRNLIYGNVLSGVCNTFEITVPFEGKKSDYFVPELDSDVMRKCLTFRSIRELAQFELPTVTNPIQLGGRIGREVEVSPYALPRDAYLASVIVQVLLLFSLIHFGAYAREATSSEGFPAPATLFGAFARSPWTLFVFLLALLCPLLASLSTAATSREWVLWVLSVPILLGTWSAYRVLHVKSYFQPLYHRIRVSKRHVDSKIASID